MRAALLLGAALVGCAGMQSGDKLEELREAIDAYNHAFRWKAYENAAMYLPPDLRGAFLAAHEEDAASLQVEDFKILRVAVHSDTAATATVRVRYLLLPSVVVQNATLVQHWHRLGKAWILETEENAIRPIVPGAVPKDAPASVDLRTDQKGDTSLEVWTDGAGPD